MGENPGAYREARDTIRKKIDEENIFLETKKVDFEKSKSILRKTGNRDISKLRGSITVGQSLDSLKSEMRKALIDGVISRDTYDQVITSLENQPKVRVVSGNVLIDPDRLPFSQNRLAKFLENQPLGKNIGTDIIGFLYGFIVQGSVFLVIIAWKILTDLLFLPVDIYKKFTK